jgi:hypothetical protein
MALLLSWVSAGFGQTIDQNLWVTNGPVSSIARDRGTIYIGGNFTQVGPATGGWVAIDSSSGAAQQPYPMVAGTVHAVAADGSGGWYLGGSFTAVRGEPRGNLAHLDASGNLTAWNPNVSGGFPTFPTTVYTLAVVQGTVYAGGNFFIVGGQPRLNIVVAASSPASAARGVTGSPRSTLQLVRPRTGTRTRTTASLPWQ